ncbi:relaxase/mobilization nuclease domain-containing protein [Pedobacter agri]|uniref:relaxase/mobilization nuclease domain-containing protein n=1 Tax=Pedobacter agri TaxID=454586 RepID=UPI003743BD29
MASGFAGEIERMTLMQKLGRFKRLTELNSKTKTNAIHISLNFHPSDELSTQKLQMIAAEYMERIGFGAQPFLVYQHRDSAHPHVHIATTNIDRHGERIDINKIGYRLSEPARKALEEKFELIRAEGNTPVQRESIELRRYGERPTRQVIGNLATRVMQEYAFSSFADFRTVCEYFGVWADRGEKGSPMFEKNGLQYFLLDNKGRPQGVPIKASDFYAKPTMANLEKRYARGQQKKENLKVDLREKLNQVLMTNGQLSKERFVKDLDMRSVKVLFRLSDQGKLYGLTSIDLERKVIFNGSELGKAYSAKAIGEMLMQTETAIKVNSSTAIRLNETSTQRDGSWQKERSGAPLSMLETLTRQEYVGASGMQKRKKKRRKGKALTNELGL